VKILMEQVGTQGHATFGARLLPGARGFPAGAMAKKHAGDWRHADRIRSWAIGIARALPTARPGVVVAPPGRSLPRLWLSLLKTQSGQLSDEATSSPSVMNMRNRRRCRQVADGLEWTTRNASV